MTGLLWKDKPGGGWMDCQDEDGSRELVQTLLPGKGDGTLQTLFQPTLKSPFVVLPCLHPTPDPETLLLFSLLLFLPPLPERMSDI